MTKDLELTPERFNRLLCWLDADRNIAATRYELIQLRLIRFFASRGCVDAENLADTTINVVASKVEELVDYVGDRSLYFHGVAKNIYRQDVRTSRREVPSNSIISPANAPEPEPDQLEPLLDQCMKELPPKDRRLVLRYHEEDRQMKIQHRKRLAHEIGITLNALRIKIYRLHLQLRKCMEKRLAQGSAQ